MKSDLAADIMREIESYNEALAIEIDNASKGTAKKIAKELSETSPKDSGDYAADWTVKEVTGKKRYKYRMGTSKYVVHNKGHYQLTHLLEEGHATKDGTSRVPAQPHIEPVEMEYVPKYLSAVEEAIQNAK